MDTPKVDQVNRAASALRVYRAARGMSQVVLAAKAGVSRATIIRIEAGEKPSVKTANAIANVIGVPVGALVPPEEPDS